MMAKRCRYFGGNNNALKWIVVMDTQLCKILEVVEVYTLNM